MGRRQSDTTLELEEALSKEKIHTTKVSYVKRCKGFHIYISYISGSTYCFF